MSDDWVLMTFGEVLTPVSRSRKVSVMDLEEIPYAGVRWNAEGVYHRDTVSTEGITGKAVYRIEKDDVVYNHMWPTKAAFGVVKDDAAGCYVTNHFPLFTVKPDVAIPAFIEAIFQYPEFQAEAARRAVGTTERKQISNAAFASLPIWLPPLSVQERIVEVIGAVDDQITALDAEARALEGVYRTATSLLWCTVEGDEAESRYLGDVMRLDIARTRMAAGTTYRLAGVLNSGKGLVDKGAFDGGDTEYTAMNVLRENQVVMRKLTAWEGPITVVPAEFDGFVASNEFPTFTLAAEIVPGWMKHVCRTPRLWAEMQSRVVGTVQRRKRLSPDQLLAVAIPVPPRTEQERAAEALDAMEGQVAVVRAEVARLREVWTGLLSRLLDGTIEIAPAPLEG